MARYEIEYAVSRIAEDVQEEYGLESNFYGDCYPHEIMELENQMESVDQEELQEMLDELREIFESYAESEAQ